MSDLSATDKFDLCYIFGGIPDSVKAQGTLAYRTSLQGIVALVLFYVVAVLLYIIAWKGDSRFTNKEKIFKNREK